MFAIFASPAFVLVCILVAIVCLSVLIVLIMPKRNNDNGLNRESFNPNVIIYSQGGKHYQTRNGGK